MNTKLTTAEKWAFINELDDELLNGGATMSEWCVLIVRECDYAFVAGANLATIITAVAAIETYLRAEYACNHRIHLTDLIDQSPINQSLRDQIHNLRKYRNKWVHISSPENDKKVLNSGENYEKELEGWAKLAQRILRLTSYENKFI